MALYRMKKLFSWLGELRLLYLAGSYVLLGVVWIWYFEASEPSIRLSGLGLQILGIGTVIWGIAATRKQFGHPPVISLMISWLRRFPLIRRRAYIQPEGISVGASIGNVRLVTVFTPKTNLPLDERLEHIEKGLETIQKRLESTESHIDREVSISNGKIQVEAKARKKGDEEVMSAVELSSTGGVHISAIGAFWLFTGLILSTASHELALWLK